MLDPLFDDVHSRKLYKIRNLSNWAGFLLCTVPMSAIAKQKCHIISTGKLRLDPLLNGLQPRELARLFILYSSLDFNSTTELAHYFYRSTHVRSPI